MKRLRVLFPLVFLLTTACRKHDNCYDLIITLRGAIAVVRSEATSYPARIWFLLARADAKQQSRYDSDNSHSQYVLDQAHYAFVSIPLTYMTTQADAEKDGFALYPLLQDNIQLDADCQTRLEVTNGNLMAQVKDFAPDRARTCKDCLTGALNGTRLAGRLSLANGVVDVIEPIQKRRTSDKSMVTVDWLFFKDYSSETTKQQLGQAIVVKMQCSTPPTLTFTRGSMVRRLRLVPRKSDYRRIVKFDIVNTVYEHLLKVPMGLDAVSKADEKGDETITHLGWIYEASETQPPLLATRTPVYSPIPHLVSKKDYEAIKGARPYCTIGEMLPPKS